MPDTGDSFERVELIASVIEGNGFNAGYAACISNLLIDQRVVVLPGRFEFLQMLAICYPHLRSFRELRVVCASGFSHK